MISSPLLAMIGDPNHGQRLVDGTIAPSVPVFDGVSAAGLIDLLVENGELRSENRVLRRALRIEFKRVENPFPALSGAEIRDILHPNGYAAATPKPHAVPTPAVVPVITGNADRYAQAALNSAAERIAQAGEGGRKSTLNAEAYSLGRFVEAGVLAGQVVADALASAAMSAGFQPHEVEATLRSAFRARGVAA